MTENQKKAEGYLRRIQDVERILNNKRDELEALRYKAGGAGGICYDKDHVQTTPQDFLAMAMADIIELEKEIEEDEAGIETIKGEAYSLVRQLKQPEHRTIIVWFYLNGLSMPDTALKMNMSERNAYYLKDDALECFGELM